MAIIYDPTCPKLTNQSYSSTYLDMLCAVSDRFDELQLVTASQSAKDIEADVILIYDIHSSHHIEIDGLADHKAVKYTYFNDPHQKEYQGRYKDGPEVHKLGELQRVRRALQRGVDHIICPYTDGYWRHIAPHMDLQQADDMLFWFPPAPSIKRFAEKLRTKPLSDRKHKILANGILHGGNGAYDFRKWAYAQKNAYYIGHAMNRDDVPRGAEYATLLSQFAGAFALCGTYCVPKYLEIPLSGCVCFAQDQEDYRRMGFSDLHNFIQVTERNFTSKTTEFLKANMDSYAFQLIADQGRKLIEENWTAEHFADALYNHAKSKGA